VKERLNPTPSKRKIINMKLFIALCVFLIYLGGVATALLTCMHLQIITSAQLPILAFTFLKGTLIVFALLATVAIIALTLLPFRNDKSLDSKVYSTIVGGIFSALVAGLVLFFLKAV